MVRLAKNDALKDRLDELFSEVFIPEQPVRLAEGLALAQQRDSRIAESTTVGDLPLQSFRVEVNSEAVLVDHALRYNPDLAGVMVYSEDSVLGVISRRKFYEQLGKQFGVAIYLNRPIYVMLDALDAKTLAVPPSHSIAETVRLALARPADQVYEPVLVHFDREECFILDIYTLLLAQTRLLTALQQQVIKDNEELEQRVKERAVELLLVNSQLEKEIAEKRRAEEKLHIRLEYEKTLNLCAAVLLTGGESHGIIQKTLAYLIEAAGTSRVFVLENVEIEGAGSCLKLRNQVNAPQFLPISDEQGVFPQHLFGDWIQKLWNGRRVIGHVDQVDAQERELLRELGIVSILLIPIGEPGNWAGVVGFGEAETRRAWDEDDIQLLYTVAQMLYAYLERRRKALELAQARDEALQASQFKSELLARVSHELRTPLGAVLGYAQLLYYDSYGKLTPEQKSAAEVVISSTKYLATLVNGILDQAQLDSGQLTLHKAPFSVQQMAAEVETRIRVLAESKGLEFVVNFAADTPEEFSGDRVRIEQVLTNLLGNAVKFTDAGMVKMQFGLAQDGRLSVEISDTGSGIPEEAQARIFEPFTQADGSLTRRNSGTGLGLSISKQLVEMMAGQIKLKSENGKGSTFTVLLPIQ